MNSRILPSLLCFVFSAASSNADDAQVLTNAQKGGRQATSENNLKQIALAMHKYHSKYRSFPPAASIRKGKRLLSWRVYLLPHLNQNDLFRQFHLNEPWNSPNNKKLIAKMPKVFADPDKKVKKLGMTRYLAPVGKAHIFDGTSKGVSLANIRDGSSLTIMLVEAAPDNAVVWTRPDDLRVDARKPTKGLLAKGDNGFLVALCDGSVRLVPKDIKPMTLRALFTRNGREVVNYRVLRNVPQ